jgi:hypothetical protein
MPREYLVDIPDQRSQKVVAEAYEISRNGRLTFHVGSAGRMEFQPGYWTCVWVCLVGQVGVNEPYPEAQ